MDRNLYDLLNSSNASLNGQTSTSGSGDPMHVLLNAIESNPVATSTTLTASSLPAFAAFFNPNNATQDLPSSDGAPAANMSISTLLAASQQLATPLHGALPPPQGNGYTPSNWSIALPGEMGGYSDPQSDLMLQYSLGMLPGSTSAQSQSSLHPLRIAREPDSVPQQVAHSPLSTPAPSAPAPPSSKGKEVVRDNQKSLKRVLESESEGDSSERRKEAVEPSFIGAGWERITTILCLHANVAQKSYGAEKRYLTPPPMIRISGRLRDATPLPQLQLTIVGEESDRHAHEHAPLSTKSSRAFFKNLHFAPSAKAKTLTLELGLHDPTAEGDSLLVPRVRTQENVVSLAQDELKSREIPSSSGPLSATVSFDNPLDLPVTSTLSNLPIDPTLGDAPIAPQTKPKKKVDRKPAHPPLPTLPFATFSSSPIPIITKPSKKTAKARNTTSCIFDGSLISLYNRINSQTFRTSYMTIDLEDLSDETTSPTGLPSTPLLSSRIEQWSAFRIQVLRRHGDSLSSASKSKSGEQTVTYGSEVILTDYVSGVSSPVLIMRKVEKNTIILDATGPVSQLQKMAFCRLVADKNGGQTESIYLSTTQDAEGEEGLDQDGRPFAQKEGVVIRKPGKRRRKDEKELREEDIKTKPVLIYKRPNSINQGTGLNDVAGGGPSHEVNDESIWTVIGIDSFSYSFFDTSTSPDHAVTLPSSSITPFPALSSVPEHDADTNTLSLSITENDAVKSSLQVWLGSLGPLKTHLPAIASSSKHLSLVVELPPFIEMLAAIRSSSDLPPSSSSDSTFPAAALEQLLATSASTSIPTTHSFQFEPYGTFATSAHSAHPSHSSLQAPESLSTSPVSANYFDASGPINETDKSLLPTSDQTSNLLPTADFQPHVPHHPTPSAQSSLAASNPISTGLPIILVRPSTGTGYLTGRSVVLEMTAVSRPDSGELIVDKEGGGQEDGYVWVLKVV